MTADKTTLMVTHIVSGDLWAGAEAQVFQLVQRLSDSKTITPSVVVFNDGPLYQKLKNIGVSVEIADEKQLGPAAQIIAIRKHLIQHQAHVVHTHGFKENILGTIAQRLSRVPRSLRTVHGNPETHVQRQSLQRRVTNLMDKLAGRFGQNAIVAVSSQLYEQLSEEFPGKTTRILNFIDTNALSVDRSDSSPLNGRTDIILGLVGRLVPVKRVDLFLETIAVLRERHKKPVKGVVIGSGPLLGDLEKRVASLGLSEHIRFTGFSENVHEEMLALNALVMPSDHEGLPMTLLEALALRVPAIGHNVGGIPEVLDNGHCGLLVNAHTPEGYAEAVLKLMKMEHKEVEQMTHRGLNHLMHNFDSQKNSEKYEYLYSRLVNS